jgi:hypothetical protein
MLRITSIRIKLLVSAVACASALACVSSLGPPNKATTAQVNQMNQEISGGSSGFGIAPDWAAMSKAIGDARNSVDRLHWIGEFAHHAAALPEPLRTQRLTELKQLVREAR